MKVILTGGTGFVGAEVLRQLADDPAVTKVTCLVRWPVEIESPKVESVALDDFTQYNDELVFGQFVDPDGATHRRTS